VESSYERWTPWPLNWSAVWVGALSAIAVVFVFGLIGVAIGAHLLGAENRVVDLKTIGLGTLAFSVFSAFLSFVIGGWVAGKVAGILRSEPAMLHGAVAWLTAVPALAVLAAFGAGGFFGGWYGGLAGTPVWATQPAAPYERPEPLGANATEEERTQFRVAQAEYQVKMNQWREDTPRATRNAALGAVTALLLSLVGAVVGGWMASGEPMTFTHHRLRTGSKTETAKSRI